MTLLLCALLAHAEPDSLSGVLSPSDVPADAIPALSPSAPPSRSAAESQAHRLTGVVLKGAPQRGVLRKYGFSHEMVLEQAKSF